MTAAEGIGCESYRDYLTLLIAQMRKQLQEEEILACALFGSVARHQARVDSDIDLLVVVSRLKVDTMPRFVGLLRELEGERPFRELREKGLFPDPYPLFLTVEELEERPLVLLDVADHGIVLYDTGVLREQLTRLQERLKELKAQKVLHPDGTWHWDLKPGWRPGEVIEL